MSGALFPSRTHGSAVSAYVRDLSAELPRYREFAVPLAEAMERFCTHQNRDVFEAEVRELKRAAVTRYPSLLEGDH